jgi:hypothetical protein
MINGIIRIQMMGNTVFLVEESNKESLTRPFFDEKTQSFAYSAGETLPYEQLGGEGFERLCYLILLNENKGCIPHYFGRKGQADHGVDLTLQDKKGDYTLYQCKNWKYKDNLSVKEFRGFFDDFNNRWVREQDLPKPGRFIFCTSMKIDEHKPNHEAFLDAKKEFEKKFLGEWGQSILVEYWDRTAIDNKLKKLPDITADMFSSDIAMRHCVDLEDWKEDIFIPVNHRQKSIDGYLKDYFNKREKFYIPEEWKIEFFEKIKETNTILIKGYPGTGKTCISLELASQYFFDNTKIGKHPYVYYLNFKDYFTPEELIRGIKRRRSIPTVFIFDDCQAELERVNTLNQRIRQIIKDGDIYCIYLYRTTLTEEDKTDEDPDFIDFFGKENIVKFKTGNQLFERILEKVKPWLIKEIDINKLYRLAGGDLYILDFILSSVNNAADFDKFNTNRNELYEKVIDKYFKTRVGRGKFDGVLKISSLAQFDIGIHPGYHHNICKDITGEKIKKALGELVVEAGPPGQSKCYFLHSSLAELICRSAFYINGSRTPFIEDISANVVEYFKFLSAIGVPREEFNKDLGNFLSNVLKLSQDQEETGNIKKNFLNSKEILQMVKKIFELIYPDSIMKMLLISEGHGSFNNYYNILKEKIKNGTYIDILISCGNIATGLFIKWMDTSYSGLFKQLKSQIDGDKLNQLIKGGNFQSFIKLLSSFFKKEDKEQWDKLLETLHNGILNKIIEKTIHECRSIGTIHLGLRELKDNGLLYKLEKKIGAANYLNLIENNGTFIELNNFIEYSTNEMASALIERLSADRVSKLIDKTIDQKHPMSIYWGIKRLKNLCDILNLDFEEKIGTDNIIRLIIANGNLRLFPNVLEPLFERQKIKLIEAFNCLPEDEKDDFILRGHFDNLCFVLVNCPQLHIFSSYTMVHLMKKAPVIEKLIEKSNLKSINMGIKFLDNFQNQELKTFLLEYATTCINNLDPTHITFESNCEKINFLLILNRRGKLDKHTIENIISTIDDKKFSKENGFITSLRLLEFLLSVYEVDTRLKKKILDLSNSNKTVKALEKENLLDSFLYLWNIYALFKTENPGHFHQWVNPETVNILHKIIEKNNRAKWGTEEYRRLLSLIGLLNYLQIEIRPIRQIFPSWYRINPSETFLKQDLENDTFIPGFFYLKGIEFFIKRPVFPHIWKKLIPKIDDYSEKWPAALQEVINVLQKKIRGK